MERNYSEKTCLCALNRLLGFEPQVAHRLLEAADSARELFSLSPDDKLKLLGPFSRIAPMLDVRELDNTEEELFRLSDSGYRFITMDEPGYPALLRECPDAPLGLYYRGTSPPETVFNLRPQIAVVGTRDISMYGREWCRKIVGALGASKDKPMIVSGFALGTDITATSPPWRPACPRWRFFLPASTTSIRPGTGTQPVC